MKMKCIPVLAFVVLTASTCFAPTPVHPNIVFFLADDQGYGDLRCSGSELIATPNLDQSERFQRR